jgi:Leucine-rich repeat (LRR) protein
MAANKPITPELCRSSIPVPSPLWILLAAIALSLTQVLAGNPAAEDSDENAPLPEQQGRIAESIAYRCLFGPGSDAVVARKRLDELLSQKVSVVDRVCGLTETQKQRLQLAGRGDNKRLIDRLDEMEMQCQLVRDDADKVKALVQETVRLMGGISEPGPPLDKLLFDKTLEQLLNVEQRARYEPLRVVVRIGGLIRTQPQAAGDVREIILTGTPFADDDLAVMSKLSGLQTLALDRTRITDTGLAHLKKLTRLSYLRLDNTKVTDAGLAHVAGLSQLEWLELVNTKVTDAGLAHLEGLTELISLELGNSTVTDAGLAHLVGLTKLRALELANTQVTDAGLTHLKGLTKLEWLGLRMTGVTDGGVAKLKEALPGLKIEK